jgi:hypothetical protein
MYRLFVLISSGLGTFPAAVFLMLFIFVDKPKYRDRYAWLLFGFGLLVFLGFFTPFVLAIFATPTFTPRGALQWALAVVLRGLGAGYMWWLLWIYLTPRRAKIQLTRRNSSGETSS